MNAIPELVTVETYVRGASFDAILAANTRINRALTGAALSIGAQIEIIMIIECRNAKNVSMSRFYRLRQDSFGRNESYSISFK